jgi:hypothetical protein
MSADLLEAATTGRAKCRACGQNIEKGALRFGERVPNPYGDGDTTHWFHLYCAAEQHAEKLGAALDAYAGDVPDRELIERVVENGRQNPKLFSVRRAERAPSGRARCQHCHEKIEKDSWRIAFERDPEPMGMVTLGYVHLHCGPAYFGKAGLAEKLLRLTDGLTEDEIDEAFRD